MSKPWDIDELMALVSLHLSQLNDENKRRLRRQRCSI